MNTATLNAEYDAVQPPFDATIPMNTDAPVPPFEGRVVWSAIQSLIVFVLYGAVSIAGYFADYLTAAQCGFIGCFALGMTLYGFWAAVILDRDMRECREDYQALSLLDLSTLATITADKTSSILRKSLVILARHGIADVDYRPVVKTQMRLHRERTERIENAAELGPILGILGSVVGMSVALAALASDAGPEAIRQSLQGASTALLTTGAGAIVLCVLKLLHASLSRSITRMEAELGQELEFLLSRNA